MENILKMTKMLYSSYFDENGHIMKEPTGRIGRIGLPQKNLDFLYRYIEFIMNSKLLNEASKIYVKSPYESVKAVFEMYNKENPDKTINVKTGISNVDYNRRKLNRIFDEDMLVRVIQYYSTANVDRYQQQLDNAIAKYSKDSVFMGKVMIDLPKSVSVVVPDGDEIDNFKMMISAYRNSSKKLIEPQIKEMYEPVVAYFNFISSLATRNEEQEEQWRDMYNFLTGTRDEPDNVEIDEIQFD